MARSQTPDRYLAFLRRRSAPARKASTALFFFILVVINVGYVYPVYALERCSLEPGAADCVNQQVDPGSVPSTTVVHRHVGNPIDVISGNKYQRGDDYAAFASPLVYIRHYNTALVHQNIGIGYGWRNTYSLRLYEADGIYTLVQSDGRTVVFNRLENDRATRVSDNLNDGRLKLKLSAGEDQTEGNSNSEPTHWQLPDGRVWTFSGSYPTSLSLPDGTGLTLVYQNKRLHSVTDDVGQELQFFYTTGQPGLSRYKNEQDGTQPGHLRCVLLPDGTGVRYDYDTHANLVRTGHPDGIDWDYAYEDDRFASHITHASRHPLKNSITQGNSLESNPGNNRGCEEFSAAPSAAPSASPSADLDLDLDLDIKDDSTDDLWASRWEFDEHGRAVVWSRDQQKQSITVDYDVEYAGANGAESFFGTEVRQSGVQDVFRYRQSSTTVQQKHCEDCDWQTFVNLSSINNIQPAQARNSNTSNPVNDSDVESTYQLRRRLRASLDAANIPSVGNRFGSIYVEIPESVRNAIVDNTENDHRFSVTRQSNDAVCKSWLAHTNAEVFLDSDSNNSKSEKSGCQRAEELLMTVALALDSTNPIPMGSERGIWNFLFGDQQPMPPGPCPLPAGMTCDQLAEAIEYAALSACAYDTTSCPQPWIVVDAFAELGVHPALMESGGFFAVLVFNPLTNEYVLSFEGTNEYSLSDWIANIQNHVDVGNPMHYLQAINLANEVSNALNLQNPGATLSFTGHSLGGGLAAVAALETNNEAVVFNSAAVGQNVLTYGSGINIVGHESSIDVINTSGDPVTNLQQAAGWPALGTHFTIGDPDAETIISAHYMSTVQNDLGVLFAANCP